MAAGSVKICWEPTKQNHSKPWFGVQESPSNFCGGVETFISSFCLGTMQNLCPRFQRVLIHFLLKGWPGIWLSGLLVTAGIWFLICWLMSSYNSVELPIVWMCIRTAVEKKIKKEETAYQQQTYSQSTCTYVPLPHLQSLQSSILARRRGKLNQMPFTLFAHLLFFLTFFFQ